MFLQPHRPRRPLPLPLPLPRLPPRGHGPTCPAIDSERGACRGLTEKVFVEQQTFMTFYSGKQRADPAFSDCTIFIDATSLNQQELAKTRRATGPRGAPVLGEAPSDRGANYDFLGGISRTRGLLGAYVYKGTPIARSTVPASLTHCTVRVRPR